MRTTPHTEIIVGVFLSVLLHGIGFAHQAKTGIASRLNSEGLDLLEQGRIEEAAEKFRRALETDPDKSTLSLTSASCCADKGHSPTRYGWCGKPLNCGLATREFTVISP
jgi:tetratricopeptide (TPR) repeat protein